MTTNKDSLDWIKQHLSHAEQLDSSALPILQYINNALQTQAELVEALKWYVENDDTNEGDATENGGKNWDVENAYYIAGKNRAIEALARAEGRE